MRRRPDVPTSRRPAVDLATLKIQFQTWKIDSLEEVIVVRNGEALPLYPS